MVLASPPTLDSGELEKEAERRRGCSSSRPGDTRGERSKEESWVGLRYRDCRCQRKDLPDSL